MTHCTCSESNQPLDLARLQKGALCIFFPDKTRVDALESSGLATFHIQRHTIGVSGLLTTLFQTKTIRYIHGLLSKMPHS